MLRVLAYFFVLYQVECCFGRLKTRFRILKLPILTHSKENVDNMFLTCCCLHNILLKHDGHIEKWDKYIDDGEFSGRTPEMEEIRQRTADMCRTIAGRATAEANTPQVPSLENFDASHVGTVCYNFIFKFPCFMFYCGRK